MTQLTRGDDDLHYPDGSHRTTPPTTNGRELELYERRIRAHLHAHAIPVPLGVALRETVQNALTGYIGGWGNLADAVDAVADALNARFTIEEKAT